MQRGLDVSTLVQRHDDALFQVQPVVSADRHSQQPQAADCKDTAEQHQSLPAARAHGSGLGSFWHSVVNIMKSSRNAVEEKREKVVEILVEKVQLKNLDTESTSVLSEINTHWISLRICCLVQPLTGDTQTCRKSGRGGSELHLLLSTSYF